MKTKKRSGIREGNRFATFLMYFACVMIAFITLYPMYYVLILSLSSPQYASTMRVYTIPKGFDLSAYKVLVQNSTMWRAYLNTIVYVLPNTVLMIITSSVVAYGLNYKKLIGRKWLTMFLLIPMYFGGGMIPTFLLIVKLGLYDSPLSQIIPSCFSIWNIILIKAYFKSIPDSLSEAAKIDGAGQFTIFWRIVLPVLKPGLATVGLFLALGYWNDWYRSSLFSTSSSTYELQFYLSNMLNSTTALKDLVVGASISIADLPTQAVKMAMAVVVTGPVLLLYPFVQKYFVSGITIGAVKG